jgi:hypothetical protein
MRHKQRNKPGSRRIQIYIGMEGGTWSRGRAAILREGWKLSQ